MPDSSTLLATLEGMLEEAKTKATEGARVAITGTLQDWRDWTRMKDDVAALRRVIVMLAASEAKGELHHPIVLRTSSPATGQGTAICRTTEELLGFIQAFPSGSWETETTPPHAQ
jgi:hypothetical protein